MKVALLLLLAGLLSSCSSLIPEEPSEMSGASELPPFRKKILVLRFLNRTGPEGDELVEQAFQDIRKAVEKEADLIFVPQEDVDTKGTFTVDGAIYNQKTILEHARAHGIAGLIQGSIDFVDVEEKGDEIGIFNTRRFVSRATVRFQLTDLGTGKEVASLNVSGEAEDEHTRFLESRSPDDYDSSHARAAVSKALDRVLSNFPTYSRRVAWSGRIAKVNDHRYYINAGEQTGIKPGQLLKVFSESIAVTDSKTGTLLGMAPGRLKGMLKVVDLFGSDGSVATLHSGSGIREHDRLELVPPP